MREFFKGWRRKAGCVTLVMACMLMAGWVRSLIIRDEITVHGSPRQTGVSMDGFVTWSRFAPDAIKTEVTWTAKEITSQVRKESRRHGSYDWKWECCGFLFGTITTKSTWWSRGIEFTNTEDYWQVPYWSATVPLTLLSGFLILWKPRKKVASLSGQSEMKETTDD